MAHIHHLGDQAPAARPFIHLGATSAYVTDNADLVLMREAMQLLLGRIGAVLVAMGKVARRYRALPCLAYTHFQPAQLTTVGKRTTLWMQDLALDAEELLNRIATLRFRGVKGTTGTQASFLELFDGDHAKVAELDSRVSRAMRFDHVLPITGQTYTRKLDGQVLAVLSGVAQSAAKFATDLRLLQHEGEVLEPFESEQVGSSAMPYKRNPMRAERMTSLARFVIELEGNAWHTAAEQWLERTLDDSANRRLVLPEAFLATDAIVVQSRLPLPLLRRGKVREVYAVDDATLLLVASDRVSAFDVVLNEPVPHKGAVLTQLSAFWFARLAEVMPHHYLSADADEIVAR